MAGYMRVIMMGNLTRDPEFKTTPNGTAVCEFGLAVNYGRRDDPPYFGQVVAFGKTAEVCSQYLLKGSSVLVEGKLKNDEWTDKQTGEKRSKTRVIAEQVSFVGQSNNSRQNAQSGRNTGYSAPGASRNIYAEEFSPPPMPIQQDAEDDIPF